LNDYILDVTGIRVGSSTVPDMDPILDGISLRVLSGTMHGLVGETGSGKSMTAKAVVGLLPRGIEIVDGSIVFNGLECVGMDEQTYSGLRGRDIGMIFQNPRTALYPLATVRAQISNILKAHLELSSEERTNRIYEILNQVGIEDPERVGRSYPHELSGGMAQRVVIAAAIVCGPKFVIADEPTTGLDLTIQRQILELISELQKSLGLSILMITHDLGIVAQYCDSVTVLKSGSVVEAGDVGAVLVEPNQEYTKQLIESSRLERMKR
jgi:ABC-type dipeptide/oligopeptide/nickel transport system ATPase component